MKELQRFRELYWPAFKVTTQLKTHRLAASDLRADLEFITDILAGPLFSIFETGDCHYVFDDKARFPTIHDARTFREWCLELVEGYRRIVRTWEPANNLEQEDIEMLLAAASLLEELSHLAYKILLPKERSGARG